jgi:hypothetical protein
LSHPCYIRIIVASYKGWAVPPQCARCQAPPACCHYAEKLCWRQCEKRFEPNFMPICALCRGCPYFRNLMEEEMRNGLQPKKLNTKPNTRQPPNMGRERNSVQSIHPQKPSSKTIYDYPPMSPGKAWKSPLKFSTTKLPRSPPQLYSLNQPRDLPSKYMFVPHVEILQLHYRQDPRLAHKLNCTCNLRSNLSVNNSLQPAVREPANCETGIYLPTQNTPVSLPPPRDRGGVTFRFLGRP